MKRKMIILITLFLVPAFVFSFGDKEKESGVHITPHEKACILPAPPGLNQQSTFQFADISGLKGALAWGNNIQFGNLFNLNLDDPATTTLVGDVNFMALSGDCDGIDATTMWIIDHNDQYLKKVDLNSLTVLDSVLVTCPLDGGIWSVLTIHKRTYQFYAIATTGLTSILYEIDPLNGDVFELGQLGIAAAISGTFDMLGVLYLFDIDTDEMFMVDVLNLTSTALGPAGFDGNYAQGMGLDPSTDDIYLAAYVEGIGAQLRLLDKTTGAATYISNLPGETGAFAFPASSISDGFHTVPLVYQDPNIVAGDTLIVEGYYTNPDVTLLFENYGDALKNEPPPLHAYIALEGVIPPVEAWNGGYIFVRGVVTFQDNPFPYYPEDPRRAIIEVIEVAVFFDGSGSDPDSGEGFNPMIDPDFDNSDACDPCKFAVLISGGIDADQNYPSYWKNLAALYNHKVTTGNYCSENVFVHYYNGTARDATIPQARVSIAHKDSISKSFTEISRRVAACKKQGKPATLQKLVTNHGESDGDICLLGNNVLKVSELKAMQQKVIDSCCSTVKDEFLQCYAGYAIDGMSTMNTLGKATIYANSSANRNPSWGFTNSVDRYLAAKIAALAEGYTYPEAVGRAKLGYDEYLKGAIERSHNRAMKWRQRKPGVYYPVVGGKDRKYTKAELKAKVDAAVADSLSQANGICKALSVTVTPMKKYCDWQQYVVPPGGHLALDFSGGHGNCGNISVYKDNKSNKIGEWNWNLPGSARYEPGFDHRIINGDADESTTFWIHNDNGPYTITGSAKSGSAIQPDFNPLSYVGNSSGGNDNSYIEFSEATEMEIWIEDLDVIPFSMQNLPAFMGPDFTSFLGGNFNVDPTDIYASQMEFHLDIVEVLQPGILTINSSGSLGTVQVEIMEPGEYDIPLGDFRNGEPMAFIEIMAFDVAFSVDCWGIHSVYDALTPAVFAGLDATIEAGHEFDLVDATAVNASDLLWTSTGDGVFSDPLLLNPSYTPGPLDTETGMVELCLTGMPNPPWLNPLSDCMTLTIRWDGIRAGNDQWMVPGATIIFGDGGDVPHIPPDFFGPGSEPFVGEISFMGEHSAGGLLPASDVHIPRLADAELRPDESVEVDVEVQDFRLMANEPQQFGVDSFFDVFVELNLEKPRFGVNGVMLEHDFGGSFYYELSFYPVFIFVEQGNPTNVRVFDPDVPLQYFSPEPYPWTYNPIPGDFDPIGDQHMVLNTETGGMMELIPFLSRDDFAFLAMNEEGVVESWEGTGYNNGEWYEYPNYDWWNVWFYDHPYDNARKKIINTTFTIQPYNPDYPMDVTIVYNYSTGNWPGWQEVPRPPLPEDVPTIEIEDEMIGRTDPIYEFQGIFNVQDAIAETFVIEDFNPEWLSIDVRGSNFVLNANVNHVCFKEYIPPVIQGGTLKVGDWLQSEEWHRWIGNDDDETKVEFYPLENSGIINVDFYYAIAGTGDWVLFDSDDNGVTGLAPSPLPAGSDEADGWSGYLDHTLLPDNNVELDFRARVFYVDSFFDVFTELSIEWDITPPSAVNTNLYDFYTTDDPYILLEILPESVNISTIEIDVEPKPEYFEKGIPSAQQPGGMDCGPTALAACLKYFEANGHPNVTGGYSTEELIEYLKNYCKTDPALGTWDTDLESGARDWINDHGGGFSVRRVGFDWETMRNELERCQDIITLFTWPNGGHFMTFNSVSNRPEPDGRIEVDFMDPWAGENISGFINPESGKVDGLTDNAGNSIVPDGSEVFSNVIICPEESSINPGTGTVIPWPHFDPIPIPLDSVGLWWIRIQIIDEDGNKSRLDYPVELVAKEEPEDLFLKIGDWLIAEEWHHWIGGMSKESTIELLASDPNHLIQKVDFLYSIDGGQEFIHFCSDTDGSQLLMSTYGDEGYGDGWACQFPHELLPELDLDIMFRAELTLENGEVLYVENQTVFDPTPPNETEINIEDWLIFEEDQILLEVSPGNCLDLDLIWYDLVPKADSFAKGIPPISQLPHSNTHCSPTASAACLKYFESTGDNTIAGGLNDYDLVEALAQLMKTNQGKSGTYISDIYNGLKTWVQDHGNNYTVRKMPYNWQTMRNELERCQDVISSIFWPEGGGHSMTFNSVINEPNPDGTITIDFMDPWTGQIEYGNLNPETGKVTQLSGAGNGGGGEMGPMIIICPKEPESIPDDGQIYPGPFPNPVITIPVPDPGLYFLRVIYKDNSNHIARNDFVLKRVPTDDLDFGDAPDDPFPTLLANNGARHFVDGQTYLGDLIDTEPDGLPTVPADGDDLSNLDDEDGVTFLWPIRAGNPCKIKVKATGNNALFSAWIDFNANGSWADPVDHVFADINLIAGDNFLTFIAPPSAVPGNTYARFRYSHQPNLSYTGMAEDGEVEDYIIEVDDYGDLKWEQPPDLPGLHAHDESQIADDWICGGGQVTAVQWWGNYEAVGEGIEHFILNFYDDMDCIPGTELVSYLVPFSQANETNTGDFIGTLPLYAYDYYLPQAFDQTEGQTYWLSIMSISVNQDNPAIWRWCESSRWFWPIHCTAVDWKNENKGWAPLFWDFPEPGQFSDMAFVINSEEPPPQDLDFGDAPDDPFPTLLANNGARHIIDGATYLGDLIDAEPDGLPTVMADGDDLNNQPDEDGVVFRTPFIAGKSATIKVLASADGFLNAWLDFNGNGSWADAADYVYVNENLMAGWNTLTLNVPANAKVGNTYMRFRFNTQGGLNYYGLADNGEVEDYLIKIYPENWGFIPTPIPHNILVPSNVLLSGISLAPNDAIGVFYTDGGVEVCGGAMIWDGVNNDVVVAFGDDNTTIPKDGFDDGETLVWKVHHTATGTDEYVSVVYDATMPQSDGKFTSYGLSGLTQIKGLSVAATATPDAICAGGIVQLDVTVSGGAGPFTYSWTSVPAGFVSSIKNPTDTPSQDITYYVSVSDGSATATSSVDVAVQAKPTANAGSDGIICETGTYTLAGSANNYLAVLWSSGGDGVFDDPGDLGATYTPGSDDISNGTVTLTLLAVPLMPCTVNDMDNMLLTIVKNPTVNAGLDVSACESDIIALAGAAIDYSSVAWGTSGDGTFSNSGLLNPSYYPGSSDISNGSAILTLTANPVLPCTVPAADDLTIMFTLNPTVDAGINDTICEGDSYILSGSASNVSSLVWASGGDGTFVDPTILNAKYTPGLNDISQGFANLCLVAYPIAPCQAYATACMTLVIRKTQTVDLFAGWQGLSSYLRPYNRSDNNALFSPIFNNLVIVTNFSGSFWPGNTNTLTWVDTLGYVVKMLQDDQMVFCGEEISDQVIRLQAGWNLCPVLNDDSVEAALVFDDVSTFKMVMEVAGWNMYWPDYNIHTLVYLKSGHSYYAYMNTADDIDFDVPSAKSQDEPEVFVNVSPWNDVTPSPGNHAIAFAPEACKLFAQGDVIGAFTSAGYCAGMVNFNGESFGLVLNPDDAITNAIDGFTSDEPILLKLYRPSTGQIYQLDVAWDETLDNSGSFHNYSLSAVTDVKMSTLGIAGVAGGGIQIYPNPSHGSFTIDGLLGESQIIIYNSFGEQLFTQKVEGSSTRVEMETQAKGVYLIKIETLNGIYHHKVIIN